MVETAVFDTLSKEADAEVQKVVQANLAGAARAPLARASGGAVPAPGTLASAAGSAAGVRAQLARVN